jgi:hypothetical protein
VPRRPAGLRLAALGLTALSLAACSAGGGPGSPGPSPSRPGPTASRAPAAAGFTVTGVRPVLANGSQDTGAEAGAATCDPAQLAADRSLGGNVAGGFAVAGFPAAAELLRHFLAGTGTGVNYPAGSRISRLAMASGAFRAVNGQVQAAVARQLKSGETNVRLAAGQLPTVTFSDTTSDLYWSFRGTQGLTVTGRGHRAGGRYVGTLTYVIRDSYGFPVDDTLDGFGPPMRYLQTVCGAPGHAGGAHWFPDTITGTVPFDQPA